MAGSVLVDAGFLVALLSRRDAHHGWAAADSPGHPPSWRTCDAALSEAFHLLGTRGGAALAALLKRRAVVAGFETLPDPLLLTTDTDFRIYRRHGRQAIPAVLP
jgi:hypothetical protein